MAFTNIGNWGTAMYTDVELNASAETIASGSTVLYCIEVDNSANSEDIYLKVYTTSPTVGTDPPHIIFRVPGGEVLPYIPSGRGSGITVAGIYIVAVLTGGTAGSGNPTNPVLARILTD